MIHTIGASIRTLSVRVVSGFCLLAAVFSLAAWFRVDSSDRLTIFLLALIPVAGIVVLEGALARHSGATTLISALPSQCLPEAFNAFLGGMAHEMNNPLTSIMGHLELALRKSSESAVIEHLTVAIGEANRLGNLLRTVLTMQTPRLDLN
jgi:signal transduction histidine kinase